MSEMPLGDDIEGKAKLQLLAPSVGTEALIDSVTPCPDAQRGRLETFRVTVLAANSVNYNTE